MIRPDRGRASSLMVVRSDNVASAEGTSTLPIMPAVTPALGFAGAVLIISGIIYTLYGIRNRMYATYNQILEPNLTFRQAPDIYERCLLD